MSRYVGKRKLSLLVHDEDAESTETGLVFEVIQPRTWDGTGRSIRVSCGDSSIAIDTEEVPYVVEALLTLAAKIAKIEEPKEKYDE